jgi:excisionase family DNA binding protein
MQQKTITLSAASKMFGASKMFLYKLCRNGGLTGKQVGKHIYLQMSELDALFMEAK